VQYGIEANGRFVAFQRTEQESMHGMDFAIGAKPVFTASMKT